MTKALITMMLLLWSINSYALSVSIAKFIVGNPPHFNKQLEEEQKLERFSLLKFDYLQQTYPNNKMMPLIDPWERVEDFLLRVSLSPMIINEGDAIDDDGDGDITAKVITNSVTVLDKDNQVIDPTSSFCEHVDKAPLTLQLSAGIKISSRYGVPDTGVYSVKQHYTLSFKPTICYLKPSLTYGDGEHAGLSSVWNEKQGFIYDESKTSFPTTGMDGLNYDIKVLGVDVLVAENINMIYSKTANVDLLLTPMDSQTLNVKLTGPNANNPKTFTPNMFTIQIGSDITYRFKINNWFIHNNDQSLTWTNADSWCNQLGGNQSYILPTKVQLSNAMVTYEYTRAIGGLLPEWGSLVSYELMTHGYIWSSTTTMGPRVPILQRYFDVDNDCGLVTYVPLTREEKSMCVSK